jgi:hypothetical protein
MLLEVTKEVIDADAAPVNLNDSLADVAAPEVEGAIPEVIDVDDEIFKIYESPSPTEECFSVSCHVELENVTILAHSHMRKFQYPIRTWQTVARPPTFVPNPNDEADPEVPEESKEYEDDYHNFPTKDWDPPKIQQPVARFGFEEVLRTIQNATSWLQADYIGYYTYFLQRARGHYDDDYDYFVLYFPTGDQSCIHSILNSKEGDRAYDTLFI